MNKGQAMFEFMLIVTVLLVILSFALVLKDYRQSEAETILVNDMADSVCKSIAMNIDAVYLSGKGSSMNITLPEKLKEINYSASISIDNLVVLSYDNRTIFCPFFANLSQDSYLIDIQKGYHVVYSAGEVVELT